MRPDLTISIVNHANPELLRTCLETLFATTREVSLDVWVIDNATGGRLVPEIQAAFPQVRWLMNERRMGFSDNHNQVLRQAAGRYACILNDDTIIHEGAFDTLVRYMDEHPEAGMVGPRLLNPDGTQQNCVFPFPSLALQALDVMVLPGALDGLKARGIDARQFGAETVQVDWVLGAVVVVRSEALRDVGLLDGELSPIANTEDIDWCLRSWKAGWPVVYCPDAVVTHIGGQSQKHEKPGADGMRVELYRTHFGYFRKHHGSAQALALRLIYIAGSLWNMGMYAQGYARKRLPQSRFKSLVQTAARTIRVSATA